MFNVRGSTFDVRIFHFRNLKMHPDPWSTLKSKTTARIAMGRAGGSLPTAECLAFAADHADARDAVYSELDVSALEKSVGLPIVSLHSQATDRTTYLQRPDLGRRLDQQSIQLLESLNAKEADVVLIVADGLSATAAQRHGADVLRHLIELLGERHFSMGPICVVRQARVAVEDEIGSVLHAKLAVILIGERPGLGLADSLGGYIVFDPKIGKSDADRNCVSNIHPRHLPPAVAAQTLVWLIEQSLVRRISGVGLKDERTIALEVIPGLGQQPALRPS
jgi:ethanolamine ammonia-lyase small subunit